MLSDYLILPKDVINSAAKGNTYAKTAVKEHLRKWMEAHGKDHARIEAQHIVIHSISFLKRGEPSGTKKSSLILFRIIYQPALPKMEKLKFIQRTYE
ncbi:hypothetical protein [uncultured Draconibacterium sp.]|uniref:hypothetical protein n=1 Tax=uncultured Draconibacterium sp. TaxID=1573823 RepID=UPI0029C6ED23|nr:hypothetical protein [uncultured Draconibacterium sp.]